MFSSIGQSPPITSIFVSQHWLSPFLSCSPFLNLSMTLCNITSKVCSASPSCVFFLLSHCSNTWWMCFFLSKKWDQEHVAPGHLLAPTHEVRSVLFRVEYFFLSCSGNLIFFENIFFFSTAFFMYFFTSPENLRPWMSYRGWYKNCCDELGKITPFSPTDLGFRAKTFRFSIHFLSFFSQDLCDFYNIFLRRFVPQTTSFFPQIFECFHFNPTQVPPYLALW